MLVSFLTNWLKRIIVVLVLGLFRNYADCGGCSYTDVPTSMDGFGRNITLPTSLEIGSVAYNMTFSPSVGVLNVQIVTCPACFQTFELRKIANHSWYLETRDCIKANRSWLIEFVIDVYSYTCPQLVSFEAQQILPKFSNSVHRNEVSIEDCILCLTIIDVFDLSTIITNQSPCVSFVCNVKNADPYHYFWIQNGTVVKTIVSNAAFYQPYEIECSCYETDADSSYFEDTIVTIFVKQNATCGVAGPLTVTFQPMKTSTSSRNASKNEDYKEALGCHIDRKTYRSALYFLFGCLVGAVTVTFIYFLFCKLCKTRVHELR